MLNQGRYADQALQLRLLNEEMVSMTEPDLTEDEIRAIVEREAALIPTDPVALLKCGYLYIKTKTGELKPLKLNKPQRVLLDKIMELRAKKIPVRIWVLKSRQLGVSTLIESLIYAFTSQCPNRNSLIMADQSNKSDHLFEMTKLYHEKLVEHQPHLAPALKKSNAKKLEFEDIHSQIIIETGQNPSAARAFTYQRAHLSEIAYFPKFREVMDGLLQAVPDHWDTMVIGETTANGMDNEFYEEWQKAKAGTSGWVRVFLGWYLMEEYTKPLISGQMEPLVEIQYDTDGGEKDFLIEEHRLTETYKLTKEQLNWRRYTIKNKCGGDVRIFRQEHPADDEEAFLSSGDCVFDKNRLKEQRKNVTVKAVGNLYQHDVTKKVTFRAEVNGRWKLFEDINPTGRYVIGGDTSEGLGLEGTAALALDKRTNNTVMTYIADTDPDQFALDLRLMGLFLNIALIGPENNSLGYSVCSDLIKIYPKNKVYSELHQNGQDKIGWTTTTRTRPRMISQLTQEIRENSTELRDEVLIDQALSFVRKPNGKTEHQDGKKDDLLISRMIAGRLRDLFPYVPVEYHEQRRNIERDRRKIAAMANQGFG